MSFVAVALLFSGSAHAQRGALTVPRNLAELTNQAATIVHGRVLSSRVEPHPQFANLSTVVVVLKVDETLKGRRVSTFSFRQFVWDIRDRWDAAGYRKGQELVLLMNAPTAYGLSSPAGLGQGRFLVRRDAAGNLYATNERRNAELFRNISPALQQKNVRLTPQLNAVISAPSPGPVRLTDLKAFIRAMAGGN